MSAGAAHGGDLAAGLARFLTDLRGRRHEVSLEGQSTAGARRQQTIFTATDGGGTERLIATIIHEESLEMQGIDAEAAIRHAAEAAGVPVPHIHGVCLDDGLVGGRFYVSDFVDGETIPRRVLRLVEGAGVGERVARQCGAALARLHSLDPSAAPEPMQRPPDPSPAHQAVTGLREQLAEDAELHPSPVLALGLRWLERTAVGTPQRVVVHGDCRNGNLIVGDDGLRAVLDWEGTHVGDPMEDLAWLCLRTWRFGADEREVGGFAGLDHLVAGYEEAGGSFDRARFEWWKVLGTVRWGLGLARQATGALRGENRNVVMLASGRRAVELHWDLLTLLEPELGA